jgi:hypothetical protein
MGRKTKIVAHLPFSVELPRRTTVNALQIKEGRSTLQKFNFGWRGLDD